MDVLLALVHHAYMASPSHPRHFLREWRQHRGYTLERVAEELHVTHATLSRIERGKLPYNQALLEALAVFYQTEAASLIIRNPSAPDPIWSVWDRLPSAERKTALKMLQGLLPRTGTEG